jgi:hypothetical protein
MIPVIALGFVVWVNSVRVQRVEYITGLVAEPPKLASGSPTGYAGGARELIVPEHNNDSYHWIAQTQQMLARGEWRVRHVDYDNAPFGRGVDSPSPYRWWQGLVSWLDQAVSGRSPGLAAERAALWTDPLLHLLFLAGATVFVAWQFGVFPAALFSAGVATLFPFAASFIPGAPDDRGLSLACAVWSILPLLAGIRAVPDAGPAGQNGPADANRRTRRWFFVAGVMGGCGLWVSVASQVPIILGIALGGLIAAWISRSDASTGSPGPAAWWAWTFGGVATVLAAYLIEYFPSYLGSWQLRVIHPLYGVAWLGLGVVVVQAVAWIQRGKAAWSIRNAVVFLFAVAAVAALPVVMWKIKNGGFLAVSVAASRLTKLPGGAVATNLWSWMLHEGITPQVWTTLLPVLLVLPAAWFVLRRRTRPAARMLVALALGPVLMALGFAGCYLSWWNMLDGALLALLVVTTAAVNETARPPVARWVWCGSVAAVLAQGVIALLPPRGTGMNTVLSQSELAGLIERDLARWLAKHAGAAGALVLAPPNETTTLYYYGGLRGLGTLAWENQDGIGAAIRIVSASTPEEAKELIERRGITHIVIPSWDSYLDEYARIGMGQVEGTFLSRLHLWKLPPWLRPVAYQFPTLAGFEGRTVTILEVVEEQDDAAALSRTAEYFVEMGQLDLAASVGQGLRRYPADLGALIARAQVEIARGDMASFTRTVELLRPRLTGAGDRGLPWDRRVSLAVVLARAKQMDLARVQVQRCLAEVDEAGLRSLTTGSLYRLQVLGKAFGLAVADPRLHELALDLLPDDLRSRL